MMRFYRLVLALALILVFGVAAIRVIGSIQPNPLVGLFTNPDGSPCTRPCLFGVRPLETTVEQAMTLLTSHPLTRNFRKVELAGLTTYLVSPPQQVQILFSSREDGLVDFIALERISAYGGIPSTPTLYPLPEVATFGDAVVLWGAPNYITGGPSIGGWWVEFSRSRLWVIVPQGGWAVYHRVNPAAPINMVTVWREWPACTKSAGEWKLAPWRGLTTVGHYTQAMKLLYRWEYIFDNVMGIACELTDSPPTGDGKICNWWELTRDECKMVNFPANPW